MTDNFHKGKSFSLDDAEHVSKVLHADKFSQESDRFRIKIVNEEDKRSLSLEVFPEIELGKERGTLIVVYTGNSHLQLHNCTGYVVSEELGEVTFVSESSDRLSGIVVEQGASCSLYAALDRDLISSDFTQLGVEVMLSGVALSLAEDILTNKPESDD